MLIILIVAAILLGISEVLRYYHEPKAKSEKLRKAINKAWHIYRDLALVCYMVFAYQLGQVDIKLVLMSSPLYWGLHWVITDGIQNKLKDKGFFYISRQSGNWAERLGAWYIKVPFILLGILLKVISGRNVKDKKGGQNATKEQAHAKGTKAIPSP